MDFFVDTGFVFGKCHPYDDFHEYANKLTKTYPLGKGGYYSTCNILRTEIEGLKKKRTLGKPKLIRQIAEQAEDMIENIEDVDHQSNPLFSPLYQQLLTFLNQNGSKGKKNHDSILLTNAHLWEKTEESLTAPHFVTTDIHDICNNRDALKVIAEKCLDCESCLKIEYLPDLV